MMKRGEDPGHLLPEDVWADVQDDVERPRIRTLRAAPTRVTIPAYSRGGPMRSVLGTVVHSAETPLKVGYAQSIARNWFARPIAGTSARGMVDPRDIVDMTDRRTTTWHCGPGGNPYFIGWEQAGYARLSRAEWLSGDGRAQMRLLAQVIREDHAALGLPLEIVTDPAVVRARVAARQPVGVTYHDTIRRALGGTSHTDPMPNYPTDELQALLYGGAMEEDDMFSDEDRYLLTQLHARLGTIDNAGSAILGAPAQGVESLRDVINGVRGETQNAARGIAALIARDPATITAEDLAAVIPDALAKDVADELAKRLAS